MSCPRASLRKVLEVQAGLVALPRPGVYEQRYFEAVFPIVITSRLQNMDDCCDEADAHLPADHPLLHNAQEALRQQLADEKLSLEAELREQEKELKDAKAKREDLGVELFGFQQQLRGIFDSLDAAKDRKQELALLNSNVDAKLEDLQQQMLSAGCASQERQAQVTQSQAEVDRLAAMLRQMDTYYSDTRGNVALAKRETYAAEEALQHQERDKQAQDSLVMHLNRQIKAHMAQVAHLKANMDARFAKSSNARLAMAETAATAQQAQEETRVLLQQCESALASLQKRDKALQGFMAATTAFNEKSKILEYQLSGTARETTVAASSKNKLSELLSRLQHAAGRTAAKIEAQNQEHADIEALQQALKAELAQAQAKILAAKSESNGILDQQSRAERDVARAAEAMQADKAERLSQLEEAALAERGSQQAAQEAKKWQLAADAEEAAIASLYPNAERLKATIVAQMAQNQRCQQELAAVEVEAQQWEQQIAAIVAANKQGVDRIERQTRDLDALNRKLETAVASRDPDVHLGPLEATIAHLKHELSDTRGTNEILQRQWITSQRELISLQASSDSLAERLHRMHMDKSIMAQRQVRLSQQQRQVENELRGLDRAQMQQRTHISHFDTQIAAHKAAHADLSEATAALEYKIVTRLKEAEDHAQTCTAQVHACKQGKANLIKQLMTAEAQVGEWEQKLQLCNDMFASLGTKQPTTEESTETRKQICRLSNQESDLLSAQQRLALEIQQAVAKRNTIATKGKVFVQKHTFTPRERSNAAGRHRIATELQRALQRIAAKTVATSQEMEELRASHAGTEAEEISLREHCSQLAVTHELAAAEFDQLTKEKMQVLFQTSAVQKAARLHAQVASGSYQRTCKDDEQEDQLAKALEENARLMRFLQQDHPEDLKPPFERLYLECVAAVSLSS